jgi:hypothetical protein
MRPRVPTLVGVVVSTMAPALSCSRTPLDVPCPQVAAGELVITELRGAQEGPDTRGQWIEIHNASEGPVLLGGLRVRNFELDGTGEKSFLVRDPDLEVPAGGFVVLGAREADQLLTDMDYGFAGDGMSGLEVRGVLTLSVCGEEIDQVVYPDLPGEGTWALDGTSDPDADANDEASSWCVEATPQDPDGPMVDVGTPGTPGEGNRPCP